MVFQLPTSSTAIKSAKETVIEYLLIQIFSGLWQFGATIPTETEIAKNTAMSRTSVREAIHFLQAKGILTVKAGNGSIIQPFQEWNHLDYDVINWVKNSRFSVNLLEHILEIRLIIEPAAAALASLRASTSNILLIEQALLQMEISLTDPNQRSTHSVMGDIQFHEHILDASGNIILSRFKSLFSAAIEMSIQMTFCSAEDISVSLYNHRQLFEAIRLRNPDLARSAAVVILKQSASDFKQLNLPVRPDSLLVLT